MKILIVNSCNNQKDQYFSIIEKLIQRFLTTQAVVVDTDLQILKRSKHQLIEFLYELENSHSSLIVYTIIKQAMQNFETLDMIFIVGDHKLHPWNHSMWPVNCLIRMALRLKKHMLLISDSSFESLAFHLISGLISNVSLVNGPRGSSLLQIIKFNAPTKKKDLFLDSVQGILYAYNYECGEWYRKKECGLINLYQMEEYYKNSKYIKFQSNPAKLMLSKSTELQCHINRDHFLFRNIQKDFFVIEQKSKWAIKNNSEFKVLAKTVKGPAIIEFQNAIAIHFCISEMYRQTTIILKNYIQECLKKIFSEPQNQRSRQMMVNKQRYNPTVLEIKKGRELEFEKVSLQQILLENSMHNQQLKRKLRKGKSSLLNFQKTQLFPPKLSKQNIETQNIEPKQQIDNDWQGPVIKIKPHKSLYKSKHYFTKQPSNQSMKRVQRSRKMSIGGLTTGEILSKYNYRLQQPQKWIRKRDFLVY